MKWRGIELAGGIRARKELQKLERVGRDRMEWNAWKSHPREQALNIIIVKPDSLAHK